MSVFAAKITLILLMKCEFIHVLPDEPTDNNKYEYSKILKKQFKCKMDVLTKRGK